jgi:thiol-disulfide isomerase/thioredoxin
MRFPCPRCQTTLKAPEERAGRRNKCPHCGVLVQIPGYPPSPSARPRSKAVLFLCGLALSIGGVLMGIALVLYIGMIVQKWPVAQDNTAVASRDDIGEHTERPENTPPEKSADKPIEKPADKTPEKSVDMPTPVDRPTEKSTDKPTEKPVAKTPDKSTAKPADKTPEKPVDRPIEKPVAKTLPKEDNGPNWTVTDLDGNPHSLKDYRGKVVILDFWYASCPWCMKSMPDVKAIAEQYKDKPVVVLGMNTDANVAVAQSVVKSMGLPYTNLRASGLLATYGVRGFPTTLILDQDGVVRNNYVGYSTDLKDMVGKAVNGLLTTKP